MDFPLFVSGGVAEWLCSGLQSRGRRFDSDPRLSTLRFNQSRIHVVARTVAAAADNRDACSGRLQARVIAGLRIAAPVMLAIVFVIPQRALLVRVWNDPR